MATRPSARQVASAVDLGYRATVQGFLISGVALFWLKFIWHRYLNDGPAGVPTLLSDNFFTRFMFGLSIALTAVNIVVEIYRYQRNNTINKLKAKQAEMEKWLKLENYLRKKLKKERTMLQQGLDKDYNGRYRKIHEDDRKRMLNAHQRVKQCKKELQELLAKAQTSQKKGFNNFMDYFSLIFGSVSLGYSMYLGLWAFGWLSTNALFAGLMDYGITLTLPHLTMHLTLMNTMFGVGILFGALGMAWTFYNQLQEIRSIRRLTGKYHPDQDKVADVELANLEGANKKVRLAQINKAASHAPIDRLLYDVGKSIERTDKVLAKEGEEPFYKYAKRILRAEGRYVEDDGKKRHIEVKCRKFNIMEALYPELDYSGSSEDDSSAQSLSRSKKSTHSSVVKPRYKVNRHPGKAKTDAQPLFNASLSTSGRFDDFDTASLSQSCGG